MEVNSDMSLWQWIKTVLQGAVMGTLVIGPMGSIFLWLLSSRGENQLSPHTIPQVWVLGAATGCLALTGSRALRRVAITAREHRARAYITAIVEVSLSAVLVAAVGFAWYGLEKAELVPLFLFRAVVLASCLAGLLYVLRGIWQAWADRKAR